MDKYLKYSIEDFLDDKDFIDWVLKPNKGLHQRWDHFLKEHPEKEKDIKKAQLIVRALIAIEDDVQDEKLNKIWIRIYQEKKADKIRTLRSFTKYAAVLITTICLSVITYYLLTHDKFDNELTKMDADSKGKIILDDGTVHYFEGEHNTLKQLPTGKLTLNSDTIIVLNEATTTLNQIIVPYGKRIEVSLSDGSHIWLNSGSKFSYPSHFPAKIRDVNLLGEAFFDVAKNQNAPFVVNTPEVKINVTGTKFNVSSYEDDDQVQTVLTEGKVSIQRNKLFAESIVLKPGEKAVYMKTDETIVTGKVDVNHSISWIHGYLLVEREPVTDVLKKIGRYYNRTINVDRGINGITFSGKLDLKDNIEEVLHNLEFVSSIKIINQNNDSYYVKP